MLDPFGESWVDVDVPLPDHYLGFLEGKERQVAFLFPGQPNENLMWTLVFHGEE